MEILDRVYMAFLLPFFQNTTSMPISFHREGPCPIAHVSCFHILTKKGTLCFDFTKWYLVPGLKSRTEKRFLLRPWLVAALMLLLTKTQSSSSKLDPIRLRSGIFWPDWGSWVLGSLKATKKKGQKSKRAKTKDLDIKRYVMYVV